MGDQLKHISKFMSLVLRHKPEEIGLQLDESGWAAVEELITTMNESGVSENQIRHVVAQVEMQSQSQSTYYHQSQPLGQCREMRSV